MPINTARQPTTYELQQNGAHSRPTTCMSWRDYLYWDSELDQDPFDSVGAF